MAYLSDDELLDTEGGFTGWNDGTGAGAAGETLEQALAEERLAELESELEQDEHPVDYEAELETEEEEAAPVSEKRLKREIRAEAVRRLEEAARTEKDFRVVVGEWDKLDQNRERRERDHENLRGDVPLAETTGQPQTLQVKESVQGCVLKYFLSYFRFLFSLFILMPSCRTLLKFSAASHDSGQFFQLFNGKRRK